MRVSDVIDKTRWQNLTPATSVGRGSPKAEKWDSEVIIQLGSALRLRIPVQKVAVTVEWPPDWETLKAELSSTWGTCLQAQAAKDSIALAEGLTFTTPLNVERCSCTPRF